MTDITFSPKEMVALEKGLSFVPTYTGSKFETTVELNRFFRTLRLRYHFDSTKGAEEMNPTPTDPGSKLRLKSTFSPKNENNVLETFIKLVEKDVESLSFKRDYRYDNMTKDEVSFLRRLGSNSDVVVKPADKGGATVIMSCVMYDAEVTRQLSERGCCRLLSHDPTWDFRRALQELLLEGMDRDYITKDLYEYLLVEHPMVPVIYMLPKIHKSLQAPPGRPIVAGSDSMLQPVSIYLDELLQPLVATIPSFLRNTTDLLNKLSGIQDTDGLIVATFDVVSLYTNIPHGEGLDSIRWICNLNHVTLGKDTEYFVELLKFVLTHNYFRFKQTYYLQLTGTAMGSSVAPCLANIYMAWFEQTKILSTEWNMYIRKWFRYIDDILVLWCGSREQLHEFAIFLNTTHDCIKFTLDTKYSEVNFLDTIISVSDTGISTDLYKKPTDVNSYLHAKSFHPFRVKRGLPFSQFVRAKRIVSDPNMAAIRMTDMQVKFKERGYDVKSLVEYKNKALALDRTELLKDNQRGVEKSIPLVFVSTYCKYSQTIKRIIQKRWELFRVDQQLSMIFPKLPLFSYKRSRNVKDFLVKADRVSEVGTDPQRRLAPIKNGTFPCLNCSTCNAVIRGDTFSHPHSGKLFKIKQYYTCMSDYVVYLLKCPCGYLYVGETTRQVKVRVGEHKSAIRTANHRSPVARHFLEAKHSITQLRYQVIDHVERHARGGDRERRLKQRELFWIKTLQCIYPDGMNEMMDFACFIPER